MCELIKGFKITDILAYERKNGSILKQLDGETATLVELVRLGNGNCTEERALELLEAYVANEGCDFYTALVDIMTALQLVGKLPKNTNLQEIREKLTQKPV